MITIFRSTAQWATLLLAGCSLIWFVGEATRGQVLALDTIGVLWLVGWPVLFVGFSVMGLVDQAGRR
jgi:hypothetical protein